MSSSSRADGLFEYSSGKKKIGHGTGSISVKFLWLGRRFLKITFSQQEDDPIVDVVEIRELLDEDIEEADNE